MKVAKSAQSVKDSQKVFSKVKQHFVKSVKAQIKAAGADDLNLTNETSEEMLERLHGPSGVKKQI